jgi:glycerate kinase
MKIIIAPDSFKENLTAAEVARAIAEGVRDAAPAAATVEVPMADGGEGTVEALVSATRGTFVERDVTGPLGETVRARFGLLGDGSTAVIEMAAASGLPLVVPAKRKALITTTRGTGELIAAALDAGARKILIGIGGSATTDGGAGAAQALGVKLLDSSGRDIGPGGGPLASLARIDVSGLDPRLARVSIEVACDVTNPLTGPTGAAHVYGPQKGATGEQVEVLDHNLAHLARVMKRDLGVDVEHRAGSGAAGGLGAGLVGFLGATLRPGVEMVIEAVDLKRRFAGADLVITGEGRMDRQSAFGKTPIGVARAAAELGIPVVAIVGSIGDGAEEVLKHGVCAYFSIQTRPMTLDEAFRDSRALLRATAAQVVRLFTAGMTNDE